MLHHPKFVRRAIGAVALTAAALLGGGCASIVHGGNRNLIVNSTPSGAKVTVTKDGTDFAVHSGTTPLTVVLDPKRGYFKGQAYRLKFELTGYQPAEVVVRPALSGWYFGNIVFGGLIGMLVVDPITGSMWNLTPDKIEQSLTPAQASLLRQGHGFMVVLVAEATPAERASMVRVN